MWLINIKKPLANNLMSLQDCDMPSRLMGNRDYQINHYAAHFLHKRNKVFVTYLGFESVIAINIHSKFTISDFSTYSLLGEKKT